MANPFTSATISAAYNADPPSDDGANTDANEITWAKHLSKLAAPLKVLIESNITNIDSAFAKIIGGGGVASSAVSRTSTASDQGLLIVMTASGTTLTTPDAASVTSPFVYMFVNTSTGTITLDGNGTQTINGELTITVPAGKGGILSTDGTNWFMAGQNFDVTPTLPRGLIGGLQTSNGTDADHDIDIAVGECRSADNSANLVLSTAFVKQIDASWAVGTNAGGLANGVSLSADTWYHVFLVDLDDGSIDAGFDTSIAAANLLATTDVGTVYRRIGSVLTDASLNIITYTQTGNRFRWNDPNPHQFINNVTSSTTAALVTVPVPLGIKTDAFCNVSVDGDVTFAIYFSDPDVADQTVNATNGRLTGAFLPGSNTGMQFNVITDTSAQVRWRSNGTRTTDAAVLGWNDDLGRFD